MFICSSNINCHKLYFDVLFKCSNGSVAMRLSLHQRISEKKIFFFLSPIHFFFFEWVHSYYSLTITLKIH